MGERNYISSIAGLLAEALYRQGRSMRRIRAPSSASTAAPSDVSSQYLWRGVKGKLLARDGAYDEGIALATRRAPDAHVRRHRDPGQRLGVPC